MSMAPALVTLLQQLETDGLKDLSTLLLPAIAAEVEALSPAGAQATETLVFAAIMPAAQAALASLVTKVPAV